MATLISNSTVSTDYVWYGTEIIKTDKTTTNDVLQLKEICSLLKMRNRFSKMVDEVVEKVVENKEEFDYDAGEFDA